MSDEYTPRRPERPPIRDEDDYSNPYRDEPPRRQSDGGGGSNAWIGWLIFFLIFGVGNLILYSTTGIFFIPIPRR
jgi:hypothetical protein